ncbi:hypothetical protein AB0E88_24515 [Streptomyces sp. NPDC028635]|uniref:hypothetical protein n=1 Tax=Streptomyces sp. NPDC028635 TaxID=3154800 RepID=UPI0033FD0820
MGDEDPHADQDFAHLRDRERDLALFIDHLHDGHAMGYKAIAAHHPRYGQQAVRSSMRLLTDAGHLRHIREHITVEDNSMRWVTRTYWSRTPRSPEWWAEFARARKGRIVMDGYGPGLARTEESDVPEEPADEAAPEESGSAAYRTLAGLREADARMPLSDSDCHALENLAAEWLSRGSTPNDITRALTDGLPATVTNPGGLARNRLETKMPPKKAKIRQKAARRARIDRVIMCCVTCDADELTAKIVDGLCLDCRAELETEEPAGPLPGYVPDTFLTTPAPDTGVVDVTRWAAEVRRAGGLRPRAGRNG